MHDPLVGEVRRWAAVVKCGGVEVDQEAKLISFLSWTPVPARHSYLGTLNEGCAGSRHTIKSHRILKASSVPVSLPHSRSCPEHINCTSAIYPIHHLFPPPRTCRLLTARTAAPPRLLRARWRGTSSQHYCSAFVSCELNRASSFCPKAIVVPQNVGYHLLHEIALLRMTNGAFMPHHPSYFSSHRAAWSCR